MEEIKEVLDRVESALMLKAPFLFSILREARIIATNSVPTAGVSPRSWIYINQEWFNTQDFEKQAFVLAHEVLHAANLHAKRSKGKEEKSWNTATDFVVNTILREGFRMKVPLGAVDRHSIQKLLEKPLFPDDIERMSDVEVYELLPKHGVAGAECFPTNDLTGDEHDGKTLQRGGDFNEEKDSESLEEGWKSVIVKAATVQKLVGELPLTVERLVDTLVKPSINPRTIIKQHIQRGIKGLAVNNWRRSSRKHPELPGHKLLTVPTIWCLVDTSGSIGKDELKLFLGTIYEFASYATIKVACWDAEAYETIQGKSKNHVLSRILPRIKGGGGTRIAPVLEKLSKDMKTRDIVVALSDGYIHDWNEGRTRELLNTVRSKTVARVICTTSNIIEADGWTTVELK